MGFDLGNALNGAMGGATGGAALGPWGALGGGVLAGLAGGFLGGDEAGKEQERLLMALAEEAKGRGNPQVSDFRDDQREHLNRLKALYNGTGPSLATEMLRKNTQDASQNQFAMANSGRGGAMAMRQALNNAAGMTGQAQQSAAQARAAEQLGAAQQIGLTAYGGRGQDQQDENLKLQALANNDRTRIGALGGSLQGTQLASQQPSIGDQLLASGGGIGQILALAKGNPAQAAMGKATGQLGTAVGNMQNSGLLNPNDPRFQKIAQTNAPQTGSFAQRPWYLPGV